MGAKASRLSPNEIGLPRGSGMLMDLASSGGSSEAEHGPLIVPGKRQTGVREQLLCCQIARLAPFEDRLGDVGGEIAEADNPREIGSAHSLAQSKRSKGDVLALDECRVEPMCPDK